MASTFLDSPLKILQWLEKYCSLDSPLQDQVLTLRQELCYLRTYLIYWGLSEAIPSSSRSIISSIELEDAFKNATDEFSSACLFLPLDSATTKKVDSLVSYMLQKVKTCAPEIRKAHTILWEQLWEVNSPLIPASSTDFINSVLANLQDLFGSRSLVSGMKRKVDSLKEKLSFLRDFLDIMEKRCILDHKMEGFLIYAHRAATSAACFSYLCWDGEFDEILTGGMDAKLSDLLQKIKPSTSDLMEMFVSLLKASTALGSETAKVEEIASFINFLQENSADSLKDPIDSIHEELKYLVEFLMDLPDECTGDLERISADIKVAAREVGSIQVDEVKEEHVKEMNLVLSKFLQKIKLIKIEIYLIWLQDSEAHQEDQIGRLHEVFKDQIGRLDEGLKFLRTFLIDTTDIEGDIEDGNLFLLHLESVVNESISLISSLRPSKMIEDMAIVLNISVFRLLLKIKLIQAEVMLVEIIKTPEVGFMVHMNDDIESLQEGVRFLRTFLMNPPKDDEELILAKSEATANEAASLIFYFYDHITKEDVASEMHNLLPELIEKIELLKADIRDVYLQIPYSESFNLPQTKGLKSISSLLEGLMEWLNREANPIALVKHHIGSLLTEFGCLQSFLMDTEEYYNEHHELKDLWTCITEVAHETNYIFDSLVTRDDPVWYFMLWLPYAREDIKLIKAKIMEIRAEKTYGTTRTRVIFDAAVGFEDVIKCVVHQLTMGSLNTDFVPIVGMSGNGRTTLAHIVYNNPQIAYSFHIRAWCCVSNEYQRREILLDILRDVIAVTSSIYEMDDDELAGLLYKCLKNKRYLIVLDDLWSIEAFHDLKRSFPSDDTGSRILLTTRFSDPAFSTRSSFHICSLSEEDSWTLFLKKKFDREILDHSLMEEGKKIIRHCYGLPLSIVVMAGLLANIGKQVSRWREVEERLSDTTQYDMVPKVLNVCYDMLPDHLKPCFLSFGNFQVNKEISVRKLYQLWIAKGLVQKTDSKTLDDVAEDYLLDLISRNLVIVSRKRYNGQVRACRVHDMVRYLCLAETHKTF